MLIPDSIAAHPARTFVHDALLCLRQYNVEWLLNCGASRQRAQLTLHVLQRSKFQIPARTHVHITPLRFWWAGGAGRGYFVFESADGRVRYKRSAVHPISSFHFCNDSFQLIPGRERKISWKN